MAIYIDEMTDLKLYNRKFFVPINRVNKRKNSCVLLLTANQDRSIALMTNPMMINMKMFESYYMEKNINLIINGDTNVVEESVIEESVKCDDSDYGLPSKKKYPMPDKEHVLSAIKFFNYVSNEDEAELAKNINSHIKKYDMKSNVHVGDANRFKKYFSEDAHAPIKFEFKDELNINEDFAQTNNALMIFNEASDKFATPLKRLLYKERIKNNKEMIEYYNVIQERLPFLRRAYLRLELYKSYNLFIDWSFYTQKFLQNNKFSKDRGLELYQAFLDRFISDPRYLEAGYTYKTVFVDLDGWPIKPDTNYMDYTNNINPISLIIRWVKRNNETLRRRWSGMDFVFFSKNGFFKTKFDTLTTKTLPKFIALLKRLDEGLYVDDVKTDSVEAITTTIIDKIEKSSNIKIYNLAGSVTNKSKSDVATDVANAISSEDQDKKKEALVDYVKTAASEGKTSDEVMQNLENDDIMKRLIVDLTTSDNTGININATRAKRIQTLNDEFMKKKIDGETVSSLLAKSKESYKELPETKLPIDAIDDEWKHLQFVNFEKTYDAKTDIVNILQSLKDKSIPVSIRDIDIEDISNSEDLCEMWHIKLEDAYGKRSNLDLEIPKMKDGRFMRLRGNDKILQGQLILLPIIKTDLDTAQIVSNYNKIFIRRYGTSAGKSFVTADKILKVIRKLASKDNKLKTTLKITLADNSKICAKYQLPIDYVDLASEISKIETNTCIIYFNQDEIRSKYPDKNNNDEIPFVYSKKAKEVMKYNYQKEAIMSNIILQILKEDEAFRDLYDNASESVKYTYSKASILNTEIPVIVVMGYSEGLQTALKKANIKYRVSDKRERNDTSTEDRIQFSDGYIYYENTYDASLLLNGLKECNTEDYSIKDMNNKSMWLDFLDLFGGRILADGLDNFYDLMMDPITVQVCKDYDLPYDYCEALAYASSLLANNKYNKHVDISGNRLRTNEIIAGYVYKVIAKAYGDYQRQLKHNRAEAAISCKKSAVIDAIMLDPTESDASSINPVLDIEQASAVSFKGLSGMNSDRSYGLDKRTYDESMVGTIAMSTGFAGNVGLTRWATIDANITGQRGYIKNNKGLKKTDTKMLCMTEALNPMVNTSDDPFRIAMTFIQTSKHGMRVNHGQPMLISNGADEAVSYLSGNTFSFKSAKAGVVKELTEDYMVLEYSDKTYEFVDLKETIKKNSDGGFFITVKLKPKVHKGQKVKPGEVVAYDSSCFTDAVSNTDIVYMGSCGLVKAAMLPTDEGFEDSAIIDDELSEMLASDIVVEDDRVLNRLCNVYHIVKPGDVIQEGDPLLIFQNAFEDADANALVKALGSNKDEISDLGKISIKAHVTGVVQDVKLYRTVELSEMSPSLRKVFKEYEARVNKEKKVLDKYKLNSKEYASTEKLEPVGKLKGAADGVYIEFFLKYHDKMSVGDKLVYYSANKGTIKSIFPKGQEPYTKFRPNEKIRTFISIGSMNRRMVTSIMKVGCIQKILVELDRKVKDMFNIKYPDNIKY